MAGAVAQTTTFASLSGVVRDPSRSAVAEAHLTLQSTDTNATTNAVSDSNGFYLFPRLRAGTFRLLVERDGFKKTVREGIVIDINDSANADVELTLGEIRETVVVNESVNIIQAQSVELSNLVTGQRVRELPLNGKNFLRLVFLAPGVGGGNPVNPSIAGARRGGNNYTLDGMNYNEEEYTGGVPNAGGAAGYIAGAANLISTEAIQEFRTITSNADATFGRGSGGQVNIVTKSGGNSFHGSGYEFLRNNAFDARDFFNYGPFFDSQGHAKVPPFRQNQFGGTLGGPLQRDRHFFFFSVEGFRQRREVTGNIVVPNATLVNQIPGDLGRLFRGYYVDGGIVPAQGNPVGDVRALPDTDRRNALAAGFNPVLFDGSLANGEAATAVLSVSSTQDVRQNAWVMRTDHRLTDKLTATARFAITTAELIRNSSGFPKDTTVDPRFVGSGAGEFLYTVSPTQIVEFRAGLLRNQYLSRLKDPFSEDLVRLGISREDGITTTVAGTTLTPLRLRPIVLEGYWTTNPQVSAMHTLTHGRWTLRSGFDLRPLAIAFRQGSRSTPAIMLNGFVGTTGLVGERPGQPQATAASIQATVFGTNGGPTTMLRGWRTFHHEYFMQSDWRVRDDLTVNMGVRYTVYTPFSEVNNAWSNLYAVNSAGQPVPDVSPFEFGRSANRVIPIGNGLPFYQRDLNNFQPRLGIAWNIGRRGRDVVRAGWGMFTDRIFPLYFEAGVSNIPFATQSLVVNTPFRLGIQPVNPQSPTYASYEPGLRNPNTFRYNVAYERQLGKETSISAAYVGSRARGLYSANEPNGGGFLPQALRPDARFATQAVLGNYSYSGYNSLQIVGRRRYSSGLDLQVAYTYAVNKDDNAAETNTPGRSTLINTAHNPSQPTVYSPNSRFVERPRDADYSYSINDIRHRFVASALYDLPIRFERRTWQKIAGNWSVMSIVELRSGEPYNPTLGVDADGDGDVSRDRPGLLKGSLNDLFAGAGYARTQILVPRAEAQALLGLPSNIRDAYTSIARNVLRSPNVQSVDVSLIKRVLVMEGLTLNFEANAFNVLNRVQFAAPVSSLTDSRFGQVLATRSATNPRQLQFGIKLTF